MKAGGKTGWVGANPGVSVPLLAAGGLQGSAAFPWHITTPVCSSLVSGLLAFNKAAAPNPFPVAITNVAGF